MERKIQMSGKVQQPKQKQKTSQAYCYDPVTFKAHMKEKGVNPILCAAGSNYPQLNKQLEDWTELISTRNYINLNMNIGNHFYTC